MISREEIRELAQFEADGKQECALSFYFQPQTPQNKSHREEAILAKDLVRHALQAVRKDGKQNCARADLQRILKLAEELHGNQAHAKAVFACGARDIWREFDLPSQMRQTQLFVNRRFQLKPLAMLLGAHPKLAVVLVDRHRARWFDMRLDQMVEGEAMFHSLSRRGRSDGYSGYDGGHSERRTSDDVLHHFKAVAARLKDEAEKRIWEALIVGCLDVNWPDFEVHLPPAVQRCLLGHFPAEVATFSLEQVKERAQAVQEEWLQNRRRQSVKEVLSYAKSHQRGVTGLRRVLRSLEMGEVRTLLIGENYSARAVECDSCGHLDSHLIAYCASCGRKTRPLPDVCDAVIPRAIQNDVELLYVKDDPGLDKAGNIAALLRFRAERGAQLRQVS